MSRPANGKGLYFLRKSLVLLDGTMKVFTDHPYESDVITHDHDTPAKSRFWKT